MLAACCSGMESEVFDSLPNTTNAVESHNRCSKGASPDILKVGSPLNVQAGYGCIFGAPGKLPGNQDLLRQPHS